MTDLRNLDYAISLQLEKYELVWWQEFRKNQQPDNKTKNQKKNKEKLVCMQQIK